MSEPEYASDASDVLFAFFRVTRAGAHARGYHFAQDRLSLALADHPRVRRLLLADPLTSQASSARRLFDPGSPFRPSDRVRHTRPRRLRRGDPTGIRALERTYARYEETLRKEASRHGLERPALVSSNPLLLGFAPLEWAGTLTFYATDDWTAHHGHRSYWPAYEEAFARIAERGAGVVSVSDPILERLKPAGPSRVVPNGVSEEEWRVPPAPYDAIASLPAPRFIYVGTLDSRIDIQLVESTAEHFAHGTLIFVGVQTEPTHLDPLRKHPNIHFVPPLSRRDVVAATMAADVALVPHVRNALTEAMSPLKLYEALAGGLPVAAVDLSPMRGIDDRVVLANGERGFADAAMEALRIGRAPEEDRQSFVRANAWPRRHEEIIDFVLR